MAHREHPVASLHRINVDSASYRWVDVASMLMLIKHCVLLQTTAPTQHCVYYQVEREKKGKSSLYARLIGTPCERGQPVVTSRRKVRKKKRRKVSRRGLLGEGTPKRHRSTISFKTLTGVTTG